MTLAGQAVGPLVPTHTVVWPVHFVLLGQVLRVWVPPGKTQVQVGWAWQVVGPLSPVHVMVCPVQVIESGQVVRVVIIVVVTVCVVFPQTVENVVSDSVGVGVGVSVMDSEEIVEMIEDSEDVKTMEDCDEEDSTEDEDEIISDDEDGGDVYVLTSEVVRGAVELSTEELDGRTVVLASDGTVVVVSVGQARIVLGKTSSDENVASVRICMLFSYSIDINVLSNEC